MNRELFGVIISMMCEVGPNTNLELVEEAGDTSTTPGKQPEEVDLSKILFVDYPDPDYDGF